MKVITDHPVAQPFFRHHYTTMKTIISLMVILAAITLPGRAADTNLNQSITVERPLEAVALAMQTYYFRTHANVHGVYRTNIVPGVSYSFELADCVFGAGVGVLMGEMVATRVSTNSTKLELVISEPTPKEDVANTTAFRDAVSQTLKRVAKTAEDKR
jgi:hypothetical protein